MKWVDARERGKRLWANVKAENLNRLKGTLRPIASLTMNTEAKWVECPERVGTENRTVGNKVIVKLVWPRYLLQS